MVWPRPRSQLENRQAFNKGAARFIPLLLIGIVGYATWVVIVLLCTNYLIHPPNSSVPARPGAGIAIIVIYFVLLFPAAICYFRILLTIATNPGYTPTGMPTQAVKKRWEPEQRNDVFEASCASTTVAEKTDSRSESSSKASKKRGMQEFGQTIMQLDMEAVFSGDVPPPPGLEQFYTKEAFACDPSGLPRVGGVVSETNYKFFIQFNFYAAFYTLYTLIVMAYFVAEANSRSDVTLNVHWAVVLGLAGLFTLFSAGMFGTSLQMALINVTTIDNIDRANRTMYLAVHIDEPPQPGSSPPPPAHLAGSPDDSELRNAESRSSTGKAHHGALARPSHRRRSIPTPHPWQGTITYPLYTKPTATGLSNPPPPAPTRTFAILCTQPGMNPYNLHSGPANLRTVMGHKWYDWLLPVRYSPACDHERGDAMYALGPDVERLRQMAGVAPRAGWGEQGRGHGHGHGHRQRRRRRRRGSRSASEGFEGTESTASLGSTLAIVDGVQGRHEGRGSRHPRPGGDCDDLSS
ncbi:Palmitoyltransferase pfa5 [Zalaria obscura]|uniref:Palmitoyltransferase pfa5 n=1 Tax=Zalaria obscura TaxID=2024903 RepID=A0ACC3SPA5_9PEZI